eukprot:SAG11_NODE_4312_length_1953_cov_1.033441_1_plen_105_part_10
MSAEFCVLLLLDFVMLVMRDVRHRASVHAQICLPALIRVGHCMHQADLWDDVSAALTRMCGGRLGKLCSVAVEIAAGETDLVANRIGAESASVAGQYAAQKRRVA